ncbi:MAG TPA: hypothetical protein PLP34_03565 [Chitinophagaceae bacterium]|nr:hypothetical protein [Chitinophagaceae bacterium]
MTEAVHGSEAYFFSEEEQAILKQMQTSGEDDIYRLMNRRDVARPSLLIHQLIGRKKLKDKLPFLQHVPDYYLPDSIHTEQCSSEYSARYKASLFQGGLFIDLSAGMGIDATFLSGSFRSGILVEPNRTLAGITSHNLYIMHRTNLAMAAGMGAEEFLNTFHEPADLIYIDPSRRAKDGKKTHALSDCEPDVLRLLPSLFRSSGQILIKTSPLLDIRKTILDLGPVKKVHVLGTGSECRELLFELQEAYTQPATIAVVFTDQSLTPVLQFTLQEEEEAPVIYSPPQNFLYEPHPAVMKAGSFQLLSKLFGVQKLHGNTHLYTSALHCQHFPGRQFQILASCRADRRSLQQLIPDLKAHLTVRNFPASVQELQKKLGLRTGGDDYVFACTLADGSKSLIHCRKV